MFGGAATNAGCDQSASPACGATWEWNGQRWIRVTPTDPEGDGNPAGRAQSAMAYDSQRGRVVLFGAGSGPELQETCEWNGKSWERRCDGRPTSDVCSSRPPERRQHAMAYDYDRRVVVLFGGRRASSGGEDCDRAQYMCGDTWEWDGSDWSPRCFEGGRCAGEPPPRIDHAMAYDPGAGMVLVYGGQDPLSSTCSGTGSNNSCLGTYGWNGTTWTRLSDSDTDPDADGDPGAREFWEWNGASWTEVRPTDPRPPGRTGHSLVYDSRLQKVLLFGGHAATLTDCGPGDIYCNDLWAWDGESWEAIPTVDLFDNGQPSPRSYHRAASDSDNSQMILFGGHSILSTGVWGYEHERTSRPGAVMRTSLALAEIPSISSIQRVNASVLAAGRSPSGSGARLGLWRLGQWSPTAEHMVEGGLSGADCVVTDPQDACWLRWSTTSPEEIADIIFSDEQLVGIGVTPRTPNGRGFGTLRLHYSEIRIRYTD